MTPPRLVQVIGAILLLLLVGMAVQMARDRGHQQPLGTTTMKSLR